MTKQRAKDVRLAVFILAGVALLMLSNERTQTLGVILLVAILYFIPTITAYERRANLRGSVGVINLFLGWTFIGWVVAAAMAYGPVEKQEAPSDAEAD